MESLKIKEDPERGIYVQDLTQVICKTVPDLERLIEAGGKNRKVGETAMNKDSSRSHSIFTIYIETSEQGPTGDTTFKVGKMNLVDLAGSERQSKTQATGERLKEANQINLSLSALGNVISALVSGKSKHVPYRTSKLTRLLQDSLGGNTKTIMIAALSPADYNFEETLSTLRYASRAKNIQNKPTVNEDPKDALLKKYEDEIQQLKKLLLQYQNGEIAQGKSKGSPGAAQLNFGQMAAQLNQSFKDQMKAGHIENNCDAVVQSLTENQPQDDVDVDDANVRSSPDSAPGEEPVVPVNSNQPDPAAQLPPEEPFTPEKAPEQPDVQPFEEEEMAEQLPEPEPAPPQVVIQQDPELLSRLEEEKKEKDKIQSELKANEQALVTEQEEKQKLEYALKELEEKLVSGGNALALKEREQAQKYRVFQKKLKAQKQREEQLLKEKQQKEEEVLLVQQTYKDLATEVEAQRDIIKKLQEKYRNHDREVKDLNKEHYEEK